MSLKERLLKYYEWKDRYIWMPTKYVRVGGDASICGRRKRRGYCL